MKAKQTQNSQIYRIEAASATERKTKHNLLKNCRLSYHESIADVDNKSVGVWDNRSPLVYKHLKPTYLVLVKDG